MMRLAQDLRDSILQAAVQGKLSEQLHSDSSIHDMLKEIRNSKIEMLKDGTIPKDSSCKISEYKADDIDLISIPPSWEWVKLGELCTRVGAGSTPAGGSKVYVPTGIKFFREQNIHNDGLCYEGIVYITDETNNSMPSSQVQAKDILLNITGASIGRNSLVPDDFDIANVNQHVLIIRLIEPRLRQYLHWCLCSPLIFNQMMSEQKGDKPGLSATRVSNFLLPIPPIEEQERIISSLEFLMKKVDAYKNVEQQLIALKTKFPADMRGAILQAAMQGKLTEQLESDSSVEKALTEIESSKLLANNGRITKTEQRLFLRVSEDAELPYDIPDNWKWCTLGFLLKKLTDGTHSTPHYTSSGVKFLSVKDMSSGQIDFSNTKFISKEEHGALYQRCNPERGDMLLSKVGTTGVPAYIDTDEQFSLFVSVALLKFDHNYVNPKYLYYLIYSPLVQKQADDNTRGVGNQNWVLDKIAKTLVVLPPIEEQQRIVERLDALLPICDTLVE